MIDGMRVYVNAYVVESIFKCKLALVTACAGTQVVSRKADGRADPCEIVRVCTSPQ